MNGSDYILMVKELRCVICWNLIEQNVSPCDAHHVGIGEDRHDFAVAALCKEHHQGATGIHGMHRKAFHSFWKTSDILLLAWTARELHK